MAAGQGIDHPLMHARMLEHAGRADRQRGRLRIGKARRPHQLQPIETHGANSPRGTADIARVRGADEDETQGHDLDRSKKRTRIPAPSRVPATMRGRGPAAPVLCEANAMPRPAVNVAVRAARAAGNVILRYMNRLDAIQVVEKQHLDFASEVDRMAEATILRDR